MRQCPSCGRRFLGDLDKVCDADGSVLQDVIISSDRDRLVGATLLGQFKVTAVLGDGGMGVVYRATDLKSGTTYAVKVLRGEYSKEEELVQRFEQEAEAMREVHHPNVVEIYQFAKLPDDSRVYVMEYLEGRSLKQFMAAHSKAQAPHRRKGLPEDIALHIGRQLCAGLHAAHDKGIVHRDMKPDNVYLVTQGGDEHFVKILDFGIAKVRGSRARTQTGSVFGTPHYMSPEQAGGQRDIDPRTDVYALGILLYEMVTTRVPFDADNLMGVLTAHLYHPAVPPREHREAEHISDGLEAVILRALAKKRESRYASARELGEDLERLERGEIPLAMHEADPVTAKVSRKDVGLGDAPDAIDPVVNEHRTVRVPHVRTVADAAADEPTREIPSGRVSAAAVAPAEVDSLVHAAPAVPVSTDRSIPPLTTKNSLAPRRSGTRTRAMALVAVVALLAVVGLAVVGLRRNGNGSASQRHSGTSVPLMLPGTPSTPQGSLAGAGVDVAAAGVAVTSVDAGAQGDAAESPTARRPNGMTAFVSLESEPSGARVYTGSVQIGNTPMLVARPWVGTLTYTVAADGRETQEVVIAADRGAGALQVALRARGAGSAASAGTHGAVVRAGSGPRNGAGATSPDAGSGSSASASGGTASTPRGSGGSGTGPTGSHGTGAGTRQGDLWDPWNQPR